MSLGLHREIGLRTDRGALWHLGALVVLVIYLLRDAVLRGRVFYVRDIHLQWFGQVESFVRSIAAGSWPVWDPYVSFGQPLLANANTQILYPPTWLNLLVRPWTYYTIFFAAHLLLAALGMRRLLQRLGVSPTGSLVAAALWTCSGPLLSLGNVWNHLAAAAWMPWVVFAADRAAASGRVRDALLWGAAAAAQMLAGSPDFVLMTALLAGGVAATREHPLRRRSLARFAAMAAIAGAFACALSAGQLLPSLELAERANRWHMSSETRSYWSQHPVSLAQLMVPKLWNDLPLNARWRALLFESREPFLLSLYLGPGLAALALASLTAGRRGRNALLVAASVAILVALGRFGPFYDIAITLFPPLKAMRFPAKAMVPAAFCASALAGMGFDAWRNGPASERRWRVLVAGPLAGLAATAALLVVVARSHSETWGPLFLQLPPSAPSFRGALAPTLARLLILAGCCFALAALAWIRARAPAPLAALAIALSAIVSLAWTHRNLNPTAPDLLFRYRPPALDALRQQDGSRLFVYDYLLSPGLSQRHLKREIPYVVVGGPRDSPAMWAAALGMRSYLLPPVGAAFAVFDSFGRDSLNIQARPLAELNALLNYAEATPLYARILRVGAVSQVLALHEDGLEALVPETQLTAPFLEPLRVFRVPSPLPRAYVVDGVRVGGRGFEAIEDASFAPEREVVLPEGTPRAPAAGFQGAVRGLQLRPDRVRFETTATSDAYAVLVDAFDPGWRATVDGRPAPVLRANGAFRAVPVPAGTHGVELVYRPASVVAGLLVSAAAAAVGLAALGLGLRPSS